MNIVVVRLPRDYDVPLRLSMARHPQVSHEDIHGHTGILLGLGHLVLDGIRPLLRGEGSIDRPNDDKADGQGHHKLNEGQALLIEPKFFPSPHGFARKSAIFVTKATRCFPLSHVTSTVTLLIPLDSVTTVHTLW